MARAIFAIVALVPLSVLATDEGPKPPGQAPQPSTSFSISGTVKGDPIGNVTVTLTGPTIKKTTADSRGEYRFGELARGKYTVTPSLAGYEFLPSSSEVDVQKDVAGQDFTIVNSTISGVVSGDTVKGVTVKLSGTKYPTRISKITEEKGSFSFPYLPNDSYTLTASLEGHFFTPAITTVPVNAEVKFAATRTEQMVLNSISGTVSGAATSGVTITLSGPTTGTAYTAASGSYSVPGLVNGKYTLTPSAPGLLFTPNSVSRTVSGNDQSQDFVATATQCAPPSVSFKWFGTRGSYMTTNAKFAFAPDDLSARTSAAASSLADASRSSPSTPKSPGIRLLGRQRQVLAEINDVGRLRHCGSDDKGGCVDQQVFLVEFGKGASLWDTGYRVSVEFTGLQNCLGQVIVEDVLVLEQHHLAIDVGVSFGLDPAGKFVPHFEMAVSANSRWLNWLYGDVDLRLTTLEATETTGQQPSLTSGAQTFDVAARSLWDVRFSSFTDQAWGLVVLGVGVRSVAPAEFTDVRRRFFGGARLQAVGYNAGEPAENFANTRAFLEFGYARDEFWKGTNENRIYVEGQIEIPSFGSKWVRLLVRMKIDKALGPTENPSEVRMSVLSSINPSTFGTLLGFSPKM